MFILLLALIVLAAGVGYVVDGLSTSYTYDKVGDRCAKTDTTTSITTYTYVNACHHSRSVIKARYAVTYGYDSTNSATNACDVLNRMTSWSDGAKTETNVYRGAEWHRVSTTTNGVTTGYLYDGDNVVGDLVNGDFTKLYTTPFLDQNVAVKDVAAGQTYYYSADGLGSVRTLTDAGGLVVNAYDYEAFGHLIEPTRT